MHQNTIEELLTRAKQIRDEKRDSANTALRVGSLFEDIIQIITNGGIIEDLAEHFLRKDKDDVTNFLITFLQGLVLGKNGSRISVLPDGTTEAVVDRLYVKIKAYFEELEVQRKTHVGGSQILTPSGMKCVRVIETDDAYRCFIKPEEEGIEVQEIYNTFSVGQLALMKECNIKVGVNKHAGNRYFWREVTGVGADFIDVSKNICDPNSDNDVPAAGDDIIGLGHRTDIGRQGAIALSSVDEDAPSIIFYQGINDFSLAGKEVIELKFDKATGHAKLNVFGDAYIGDREGKNFLRYSVDNGLSIRAALQLPDGSDVGSRLTHTESSLESEITSLSIELNEKDNYLSNASFVRDTFYWQAQNGIKLFTVAGRFLYFNDNFYSEKRHIAAVVIDGSKRALRLKDASVVQLQADLANRPSEQINTLDKSVDPPVEKKVWPTFYVSFKYKCVRRGILTIGFPGSELYHTVTLEPNNDFERVELSGVWDGTGDFHVEFSGDVYLYGVALTCRPLDDFKVSYETRFYQTDKQIGLYAKKVEEAEKKMVQMGLDFNLNTEQVNLYIQKTDELQGSVTNLGVQINGYDESVKLYAQQVTEFNTQLAEIKVTAEGISTAVAESNKNLAETKELAAAAQTAASNAGTSASNAWSAANGAASDASSAASSASSAWSAANSASSDASSAATSAATAISQSKDAIALVAGRFNEDGTLINTGGLVVTDDLTAIYQKVGEEVEAGIATCVKVDAKGNVTGEVHISGDKISLDGATSINNNLSVDDNGMVHVGPFEVTDEGLKYTGKAFTVHNNEVTVSDGAYIDFGALSRGIKAYANAFINGPALTVYGPNKTGGVYGSDDYTLICDGSMKCIGDALFQDDVTFKGSFKFSSVPSGYGTSGLTTKWRVQCVLNDKNRKDAYFYFVNGVVTRIDWI